MVATSRKVGIYTRISSDVAGDTLGVQRQEQDARKLCIERGWTVVEHFCDNDKSAYNPRKPRPAYREMLDAVRSRRINTIVAWHPDRLHRQTRELVPFIDLVNEHGVEIETVTAGVYDLSTPSGRMLARMLGVIAEYESDHKSERTRRRLQQNAANGRHHGGSRPYGWQNDRVTLEPSEAAVVREAAAMLLSGDTCKHIVRVLNARGVTTSTGKPWGGNTLRSMLIRPRNAGIRTYRGEEVGQGLWDPILPTEAYRQVVSILSNPARRTNPGKNHSVHLLSSIAKCGVCGKTVVAARGRSTSGVNLIYRCPDGHVIRNRGYVDDLVTNAILARLSRPDAKDLLAEPGTDTLSASVEMQQLEDRMGDAAEAFAAGVITLNQLTTVNQAIRPRLEELQAVSPSRVKVLDDLVRAEDPRVVWDAMTPDRRRAVAALLTKVTIHPTRKGKGFSPESIELVWTS